MEEKNFQKNSIKKIKSSYVIRNIFEHLQNDIFLQIIRYNKEIQKQININIENYKKESINIKIEIIPRQNEIGNFINNKISLKSVHIFFNKSGEEIKRTYINSGENVSKIKIIIDKKIKTFSHLFQGIFRKNKFFSIYN